MLSAMLGNGIRARSINMSIRAALLASRLLLLLLLARFLPPEDVGLFGLFYATVNFGLLLAGAGFHSFSNREVVDSTDFRRSQILFNQVALYVALYVLLAPVALLFFTAGLLPWSLFWLFLAILILEHLSYEAYRLFVILGRPLTASIISFMRGGIWVYVLILLFVWQENLQTLETALFIWLLGGLLSLLYTLIALFRDGWSFSKVSLDINWLRHGLKVAWPFFVGAIATRIIFTLDRYLIEDLSNLAVVGVYTFYAGMCVALLGFVEAAVLSFAYPVIVSAVKAPDKRQFAPRMRRLMVHTLATTIVIALTIYYFSMPLLQISGKSIYLEYLNLFQLLLLAFTLYIFALVPQLGLYALRFDSAILRGNLAALCVFFTTFAWFQIYFPGLHSVPASMVIAFGTMLLLKSYYLLQSTKLSHYALD